MNVHHISNKYLSLDQLIDIISDNYSLALSEEAKEKVVRCRKYLDEKVNQSSKPIYGINTGFGSLCNFVISDNQLGELQKNLVMSHACGMGEEIPSSVVKLMILLKIQSLSYGHSGVQLSTVERLIDFYNKDIIPVVYQQGSLGASGDLAPLAHLSLPLLGLGEVYYKGKRMASCEMLKQESWKPIQLKSKEGLALLNGTQMMSAYGLDSLIKAYKITYLSDLIGSLSLDAFNGRLEPFNNLVHEIRPHKGQLQTAKNVRTFLGDSELIQSEKNSVQDPYSFRCIPQVHGASKDALVYVHQVILTEINSVTDNPNVFVEEDQIISAGNFHGQPLALALDHLALALSELGNISERRTFQLISGQRGLPPYLVFNPGLNSGLMIPQYTAASIVSQNKQYCFPASSDSIVSSNGQEDHVSMGANSATKMFKVVQNVNRILAIELMTSSQALSFRDKNTSSFLSGFLSDFRHHVAVQENDTVLYEDMHSAFEFVENFSVKKEDLLF